MNERNENLLKDSKDVLNWLESISPPEDMGNWQVYFTKKWQVKFIVGILEELKKYDPI